MAVADYLNRSPSFDENVAKRSEMEVHCSKKAREETTDTTTTNRTQKKNKRNGKLGVTFSSKNEVFEITKPTKEERDDMHMSREDQKLIIREISKAIRRLDDDEAARQNGGFHDSDSDGKSIEDLGIERIVEQQDSERVQRVKSAIRVILQRQRQSKLFRHQQQQIIIDDVWLEKHYRPFSKVSANLARSRGLHDQEMAPFLTPRKMVMSR